VPTATVQARITRAKKTLAAAQVPFEVPPPGECRKRLGSVLSVLLYEALGRLAPSPVVELNRAVAISMAQGPAAALPVVDDLAAAGSLSGSHLLPSVRGELLSRLGKLDDARHEIELAVRLCQNERERSLLQRKLAALA
jgi:predicted RNA polymerase sigma factor